MRTLMGRAGRNQETHARMEGRNKRQQRPEDARKGLSHDMKTAAPVPEPDSSLAPAPPPPLSAAKTVAYSAANFGYGMFYALNNAVLPLFLQAYTQDARLLGLLGSSHSFEGAIVQPVVGAASDRLRTPWGRRRPFMLLFVPLSALFLILTPAAAHLPVSIRLAAVVAGIILFTLLFNVAQDPYKALMPDITPEEERGRVTAVLTLFGVVGQASILLFHLPMSVKFTLVAAVMVATTLLTCATIREPTHPAPVHATGGSAVAFREVVNGLKTLRQARWVLVTLFLSGLGVGAVFPFLTLFTKTIARVGDQQAQSVFLVLMIATAVSVLPMGWVTDRLGPKPTLLGGLTLMATAALGGLWVQTLGQIMGVMALAGLSNAAVSAASYPLLTEVVPGEEVGFYTGLQTTALSVATPLTAILTGSLVNGGGYRVIFLVCAVCLYGGAVTLSRVNPLVAREEVAARNVERRDGAKSA